VRSAYGACNPYELRSGGSAIAMECSVMADMYIDDLGNSDGMKFAVNGEG
jgi:hypothetical protein